MKANELRVGNWVKTTFSKDRGKPQRIIAVFEDSVSFYKIGDRYVHVSLDRLKLIRLTPEVLIQYGFVTGHSDYYFKNGIEVNIKDEELNGIGSIPLQYLHQLQNLYFALTGTELEYDPTMSETMKFLRSK